MVKFTSNEIRDIIISTLVIAFVFAFIFSGRNIGATITLMPVTLVAVGLGFIFHELAHKYVAIRYGYWAEYKMWLEGLFLALVTAVVFGFVFAAPGAVYIHGTYIREDENGKISLAGPVTNLILALLFIMLMHLSAFSGIFYYLFALGATVNSFLAFFNLIPFSVLDGAKVFHWNRLIWIVTMAFAFLLMILTMFGFRR